MQETLQYRIADVDVAIQASTEMLELVRESYRRLPISRDRSDPHVVVRADVDADGSLSVTIGTENYCRLAAGAGRGLVGIEISNAVITAVAQRSRFLVMHAATLERGGEALCLAAPGHSGKTLLAAHLASRGWHILSDEYAFIEPTTGNIVPFPKLLSVRSSSLPHAPRSFRRSIESSPWCGMGELPGVVFPSVDPAESYSEAVWSSSARLTRLLLLNSARQNVAAIEECESWNLIPDLNGLVWPSNDFLGSLERLATALRGVTTGRLIAASPVVTADVIERWALQDQHALLYA